MSEHTPEPWVFNSNTGSIGILSNEDDQSFGIITQVIAYIDTFDTNERESNARRIVACVNACVDMDDPAKELAALRAQVEALKQENMTMYACILESSQSRELASKRCNLELERIARSDAIATYLAATGKEV